MTKGSTGTKLRQGITLRCGQGFEAGRDRRYVLDSYGTRSVASQLGLGTVLTIATTASIKGTRGDAYLLAGTTRRWARRTIEVMGSRRRRHTPEQIVRKLCEADRLLGEGQEVALVAKQLEVSEQTLHRWRGRYGGLKAEDARRLKELERENTELKKMLADAMLAKRVLEYALEKKL